MASFLPWVKAASTWLVGTEAAASAGGTAATAGTVGSTAAAGAGAGAGTAGALTASNVAAGASAVSAAASLAQATRKPQQTKPTPMADPDSAEAESARRRMLAAAAARSGRASTFLSQDSKLGG